MDRRALSPIGVIVGLFLMIIGALLAYWFGVSPLITSGYNYGILPQLIGAYALGGAAIYAGIYVLLWL